MHRRSPEASIGLMRLDASMTPPDAAPAPMMVWISSMKRIAPSSLSNWARTAFRPLLEVAPVLGAGEQRAQVERVDVGPRDHVGHVAVHDQLRQALRNRGLAHPPLRRRRRGLFFRRRHRIWTVRSTSSRRPMSGSILPSRACWLRWVAYICSGLFPLGAPGFSSSSVEVKPSLSSLPWTLEIPCAM